MRDTTTTTQAQERLQSSISFFIESVDITEASEGILTLLAAVRTADLPLPQLEPIFHTLSLLNAIQRVQLQHVACILKIA
ncbi:hypothetical protein [Mucilaginibacter sp.]|uniref:hypothetical protein n=1 Tax=Mucilaginibacter sp. TaxID=1882438 RepID=UPI0025DD8719|nr:hypothetical protein [Mucilaginibacter sp.]